MRKVGTLLLLAMALPAGAQDLAARHAQIGKAYEAERHDEVVRLIEAQLKQAPGTIWQDSIHLYLYKYGRSAGKLKGVDAGIAAAGSVLGRLRPAYPAEARITALFDLSWIYYEAGRYKDCVRADSTASSVANGHAEVPHTTRGKAHQYLAFDYSILGDHRKSLAQAQLALDEYARADSTRPAQWAESYTAAGVACWHLGRIREAEQWYLKALQALGDGVSEPLLVRKASTYGNLGVLWQNAGDMARSKANYHASLRLFDRLLAQVKDPFTRDEARVNRSRTYLNLATVYFASGDAGRARELLDLAWADRSSVLQPDDPQLLSVRDRMADMELAAGALHRAEAMERAYLVACERHYGQRSEEYARAAAKLGDILARQGNTAGADSLFNLSISNGRQVVDEASSAILLGTLKKRAAMRSAMGRHAEAMADLHQARDIAVALNGANSTPVAQCEVLLAEQAFRNGQFTAARDHARQAWALCQHRAKLVRSGLGPISFQEPELLPDVVYWTIQAERELPVPDSIRGSWNGMIDLAIRSLERNRAGLSDADSKLRITAAQQRLFSLALDLAYERFARTGSLDDIQRFLTLSEADRSILLKERLNSFAGLQFAGVPDTVLAREHDLEAALSITGDDRTAITDLDRHELEYADFLAELEHAYPKYFALRYGGRTPSMAEIRTRLLTPQRQLLAYVQAGKVLYALVIGTATAELVRLEAVDLATAVDELQAAIARRDADAYCSSAYRLYAMVFAPLADRLSAQELLIIPDGALGQVNFETLLAQPGVEHLKDNLLIRRYTMAYLLSATTALQFADGAPSRAKGMLAMAPGFTDPVKQAYLAHVHDSAEVDRRYLHFVRQPFALQTANALGKAGPSTVLTGSAATEEAFRKLASAHGILFLGTHAEMNPASPMYSRLVLSKDGDGTNGNGDGYLHAYEIYALDLKAQLAVIAACESGSGKVDPGEGVRSLGSSFAYAGCPSLVASLWSIDEKVSAQIMDSFFKYLEDGLPKHEALRQAKLDFLDAAQDELALPYYWAGLVLTGDVGPVQTGRHTWWPWAMAGALLVLVGSLWWRNHKAKNRQVA
ncbi:MAG: CHAT domain-containing protein [Flavobacteriales bacterium]|nr:CHAT domain-containing protein [Flavobacteriales bacterium]